SRGAVGLMGISVRQMVVVAYVISSILAGIAGMLVAPVIFAHAEMGALLGLKAFAAAIIGGIENPIGILVVGIGLGITEFIAAGINASFRDAATFLILILLLAWRPQGLFQRVTAGKVGADVVIILGPAPQCPDLPPAVGRRHRPEPGGAGRHPGRAADAGQRLLHAHRPADRVLHHRRDRAEHPGRVSGAGLAGARGAVRGR